MKDRYNDTEQQSVRKTFAGEKNKLSKMTFNEKIDYIFSYYKLHIFAIVLIIALVTWGIHHAMTYVRYEFYGVVINSSTVNQAREKDIHDYLKMGKHEGVSLSADLYTDDRSNMGGYGNQLDIYIIAGQLDFAFTNEEGAKYLKDFGIVEGGYEPIDIKNSPIHEYFGLDDDTHYLVISQASANRQRLATFQTMLDEIDSGNIK